MVHGQFFLWVSLVLKVAFRCIGLDFSMIFRQVYLLMMMVEIMMTVQKITLYNGDFVDGE